MPFSVTTLVLILHGLIGIALLGAITHQSVSVLRVKSGVRGGTFVDRYTSVNQRTFTTTVIALYIAGVVLGAILYPSYRLDVRVPFEEMRLSAAVGLFELKEHFAGIGLGLLPLYAYTWRAEFAETFRLDRIALTLVLMLITWWDFLIGHLLNNIRGLNG